MASSHHPCPAAPGGTSGWVSGASVSTEEVRAADVWTDDILVVGSALGQVTVIEYRGRTVIISWAETGGGSRSGVLIRQRGDMVERVARDD
jgi:hypothetical protein